MEMGLLLRGLVYGSYSLLLRSNAIRQRSVLNQPWLPVERCKLAVSSHLRCESWVVLIKNLRNEANSYENYIKTWWKVVSSPFQTDPPREGFLRNVVSLLMIVTGNRRPCYCFCVYNPNCLDTRSRENIRESSVRSKKCPLRWLPSERLKNTPNSLFLNVEKKLVWVFRGSETLKCTFFLSRLTSFLHFLTENSSPHDFKPVFTVAIWLLFSKELFLFLYIRLAVRHSVIRQNEDFPPNEAHAKSDIIQSGPFSSAFVWCFLLLFWTFLWFQWWLKNLKWHNSVASVWWWGCNPNGFSAEKSLKTHTHLNLALGATGFKPQR